MTRTKSKSRNKIIQKL